MKGEKNQNIKTNIYFKILNQINHIFKLSSVSRNMRIQMHKALARLTLYGHKPLTIKQTDESLISETQSYTNFKH